MSKPKNFSFKNSKGTHEQRKLLNTIFWVFGITILFVTTSIIVSPIPYSNEPLLFMDFFSTEVTNGNSMNIPFSILLQVGATAGGILIGFRIGEYSKSKDETKESEKIIDYIERFLSKITGIVKDNGQLKEDENKIYILGEYRYHWKALLIAEKLAFRTLNDIKSTEGFDGDKLYFELNYIFNFWEQNKAHWSNAGTKSYNDFMTDTMADNSFLEQVESWEKRLIEMNKLFENVMEEEEKLKKQLK